jgi:hypothetical protein
MAEGRIDLQGWLVADVEPQRRHGAYGAEGGGRLFLFRTVADWTLLSVRTRVKYDERDRPTEGEGWVRSATHANLQELKAELSRWGEEEDWRELVRAGAAGNDPDLSRLWAPVHIDEILREASVYVRDLALHAGGRHEADWRARALGLAVDRLEHLGFVVLRSDVDHRRVFRRGLGGEWSNPVVGAVVAARLGYRVQLVVAIDGAGEVYVRTPDTNFTPGEPRRYAPQQLTEREWELVAEADRRRRTQAGPRQGER